MVQYIIQVAAFQLVFLMIYDAFLKKETFFNWNRIYLLSTALISIVIPFIRLEVFKNTIPQQFIVSLPEVIIGNAQQANQIQLEAVIIESKPFWTWENILYIGIILAALLFAFKIAKVILMLIKNPKSKFGDLLIVNILNSNAAFSFFHYIFLGERLNDNDKDAILKHEMVHVREKHTFDLLFFEVMRILFWFNPLVYMYQNRIMTLHEFIADQEAVKQQDKTQYYQNLLSQVFQTQNISFINPFFKQSLIKKRIVMLQKSKSRQVNLFKYALLIPIVFGMLIYTSSYSQEDNKVTQNQNLEQYTYTLIKSEDLVGEKKKIHEKYEAFLKAFPDKYVSWAQGRINEGGITYSVHSIEEKVPENLTKTNVNFPDGSSYIMYIDFGKMPPPPPPKESEESQKQNEEELLKLKEKYKDETEVPFAVIDQVPLFPGCETLSSNKEQKDCMSQAISQFVNRNFNTNLAVNLGLEGRQRINVIFKIDTEGNVVGIRSRAPHLGLEEEAIRVINALPKMIPGENNGKKVIVPYSLPIIFMVAGTSEVNDNTNKNVDSNKKTETTNMNEVMALDEVAIVGYADQSLQEREVPMAVVEQVPVFPGCEDLASNAEQRKCMSDKIAEHVNKNFDTDLAGELGLSGRQRINVIFKIDTEGKIVGIRSRAPHPALEEESIRVIKTLPKMIPGKQRGESVIVPYSLPIIFQVSDEPKSEKE